VILGLHSWPAPLQALVLVTNPKARVVTLDVLFHEWVKWWPCPSKINKCQLMRDIPLGIHLLKKNKNSLNKKLIIHALFCIIIQILHLQSLIVVILYSLTFKDVKTK